MSAASELAKLGPLSKLKPEAMAAFGAFDAAVMADGAISKKTKELIAVAVALTTQCQYCLTIHTEGAKKAGATEEELAEVTFVAAALRAGAAVTHGANHVIGE
ncbi:MAG: carboxymuconolactone decarboxylase family protein [Hyphomonadaceae bacterium]